jgi:hypothetical protein
MLGATGGTTVGPSIPAAPPHEISDAERMSSAGSRTRAVQQTETGMGLGGEGLTWIATTITATRQRHVNLRKHLIRQCLRARLPEPHFKEWGSWPLDPTPSAAPTSAQRGRPIGHLFDPRRDRTLRRHGRQERHGAHSLASSGAARSNGAYECRGGNDSNPLAAQEKGSLYTRSDSGPFAFVRSV